MSTDPPRNRFKGLDWLRQPWLKTGVKVLGTLLTLYVVWKHIDLDKVGKLWQQAWGSALMGAVLLFAASKGVSALRLQLFFKAERFFLPLANQLGWYWVGMFYNQLLPGGIGGDGYKVIALHRWTGHSTASLARAVVTDRVNGVVPVLGLIGLSMAFLWPDPRQGWSLALATLACVVGTRWLIRRFLPQYKSVWIATLGLSVGVQLLQCGGLWLIVEALSIPHFSLAYLVVFLLSSMVAILPLTLGGIGARELVFLLGANLAHLPQDQAVAISLLVYTIQVLISLPGLYFVWRSPGLSPSFSRSTE